MHPRRDCYKALYRKKFNSLETESEYWAIPIKCFSIGQQKCTGRDNLTEF